MSCLPDAVDDGEEIAQPPAKSLPPKSTCSSATAPGDPSRHDDIPVQAAPDIESEPTDVTVCSQTPLLRNDAKPPPLVGEDVASHPSGLPLSSGPLPMPMHGDLPADLLDDMPSEPPPLVPTSAVLPTPAAGAASHHAGMVTVTANTEPAPLLSFAPPLRSSGPVGIFPRAEAFLRRPVEVPQAPGSLTPASPDLETVKWLIEKRRVETALRILSRPDMPAMVEVTVLRLRCLVALRRYPAVADEFARTPALHLDELPLEVRILSAELPFLVNAADVSLALGQLQELARRVCSGTLGVGGSAQGGQASVHERLHVLRLLSHVALASGQSAVAVGEIRAAAEACAEDWIGEDGGTAPARAIFYSMLGRHHITGGDVKAAASAFELARACGLQEESAAALLDEGLLRMAQGDYAAAGKAFSEASAAALAGTPDGEVPASPAVADEAIAAENNLAVCRLYTRQLREGVSGLEAFARQSPVAFLRTSVVQNLSSFYEFLTDSSWRRGTLREVIDAFRLEDIDSKIFEQPGGA